MSHGFIEVDHLLDRVSAETTEIQCDLGGRKTCDEWYSRPELADHLATVHPDEDQDTGHYFDRWIERTVDLICHDIRRGRHG